MKTLRKIIYFLIIIAGVAKIVFASGPNYNDTTQKAVVANASGNIGLGTTLSANNLDVATNAAIGLSYAGYKTAPSNGLIVQGNVGVGSTAPGQILDINGTLRMTGFNIASGASSSYVLTSDANGNGAWASSGGSQWTTINSHDVYLPSFGNVGLGTSLTTTAALIIMNGNVGIGTWKPAQSLDIKGALNVAGSGNSYFYNNVGIGSVNPNYSLDINGTAKILGASIPQLLNLTQSGFVTTSGGNGTLGVDTTVYSTTDAGWIDPGGGVAELPSGNVGIGYADNYNLDIEFDISGNTPATEPGMVAMKINNYNTGDEDTGIDDTSVLILGDETQANAGELQLMVNPDGGYAYGIGAGTFTNNGNIGNGDIGGINTNTANIWAGFPNGGGGGYSNGAYLNFYSVGSDGGISFYTYDSGGLNQATLPIMNIDESGTVTFPTGANLYASTITNTGGSDPPYELYFDETRAEVLNLVRHNIPAMRKDGLVYFYNQVTDRMEYFKPFNCTFYAKAVDLKTGAVYLKEIEMIKDGRLCYNSNVKVHYFWDKIKGQTQRIELPVYDGIPIPQGKRLDTNTGHLLDEIMPKPNVKKK